MSRTPKPIIRTRGAETQVLFEDGRTTDTSNDPHRYMCVAAYIYRRPGEDTHIIIRPSGDVYSIANAERHVRLMGQLIEWLKKNVPECAA